VEAASVLLGVPVDHADEDVAVDHKPRLVSTGPSAGRTDHRRTTWIET
jgi:hypothetical protein